VKKLKEAGWTGFHKDEEKGLFIYNYMIKGFLKCAGNNLKDQLNMVALRAKIDELVLVGPRMIYLGKENADGILERPLRAQTAKGPRVALAKSDYIDAGTEINFEVEVVKSPLLPPEVIVELFQYARIKGLGQFRNGGYGQAEVVKADILPEQGTVPKIPVSAQKRKPKKK
jgi:hypothetical protein